jgi:hypothetical protein
MIEYAVQASSISLSWLMLPGRKGQSTTGVGVGGGDTNGARADELAAQDDHNGAAVWRRIIHAVGQLANRTPPGPLH